MDERDTFAERIDKVKELQDKLIQMRKIKESLLQNNTKKSDETIQFLLKRL
jgi:hypothetical protein